MTTTNEPLFESLGTENYINNLPSLMSVQEVASTLRISSTTVYRLISSKQLNAYKVEEGSNEWNIRRTELIKFLQRNETINR